MFERDFGSEMMLDAYAGRKATLGLNTLSELSQIAEGYAALIRARPCQRIAWCDTPKADDLFEETLAAQTIQKAA